MARNARTECFDPDTCCEPEGRAVAWPVGDKEIHAALAAFAKALGHPARVQIVRYLLARGRCVCGDIVAELPLAQSTVSQHLKMLREAGLICGDVEGPRVCYCVNRDALALFIDSVRSLLVLPNETPDAREGIASTEISPA